MNFDSRCYDLAKVFLGEQASEERARLLAQEIQDAIENWIAYDRDFIEPPRAEEPGP